MQFDVSNCAEYDRSRAKDRFECALQEPQLATGVNSALTCSIQNAVLALLLRRGSEVAYTGM